MILGKDIRILLLCDDLSLRRSREMLLTSAGYEVVSLPGAADPTEAAVSCAVAVLCHSFPPSEAANLAQKLRECNPAIRILQITAYLPGRYEIADAECCIFDGPRMFLDRVASLVSRGRQRCQSEEPYGAKLRVIWHPALRDK